MKWVIKILTRQSIPWTTMARDSIRQLAPVQTPTNMNGTFWIMAKEWTVKSGRQRRNNLTLADTSPGPTNTPYWNPIIKAWRVLQPTKTGNHYTATNGLKTH
jgi:hypothetical protein